MWIKAYLWWILCGILLILTGSLIFATYHFRWAGTGFLNKSLWDWLSLLIIPLVLAVIALLFNLANTRTERQIAQQRYEQDQQIAKQRYEQDQQIALEKQREDLLQIYLDRISELLLKEGLRTSSADDEVRKVARVRTITILFQLDARRIEYVFAFLQEANLITTDGTDDIVHFKGASLRKINLSKASLRGANLSGANLIEANLIGADLIGANLSVANLRGADLSEVELIVANLRGANLSEGNLSGAKLIGAQLSYANLSGAKLSEANLRGANLSEANLSEANLSEANLRGANLSEANLRGAAITQEQLQKAKSLRRATLPDGTTYKETLQTT